MKKKMLLSTLALLLAISLVAVGCAKPAPAPVPVSEPISAADFYKENTVTLICPLSAGGGTDFVARLWAAFWPDITGGTIIVKNVPGAASLKGTNEVYAAKPDGLTFGINNIPNMALPYVFKDPGRKYDLDKFSYLGWVGRHAFVAALGVKTPYLTAEDLKEAKPKGLKAAGAAGSISVSAALVWHLLDLNDCEVVLGFGGAPERALAVGRGEADMMTVSAVDMAQWVDIGYAKIPFICLGNERSELWPDTPVLAEVVDMTPEKERLWDIYQSMPVNMPFFAPPGIPKDRLEFLRDAFNKLMTDKGYMKTVKRAYGLAQPPHATGEEVAKMMANLAAKPESELAEFVEILDSYLKR